MKIIPQMLEHVKNIPAKHYCGSYSWLDKATGETFVFFCGLASCNRAYCQKLHYIKRVRLFSDLIPEYELDRFFTLTMKRDMTPESAWETIPHIWAKARRILKRIYVDLLFAAILEAHKDGYPHIHGFCNVYIPQRVWSEVFSSCGGGSYAWLEKVEVSDGKIVEYVHKQLNIAHYIGKDNVITAKHMVKPRARTFWRSTKMYTQYEKEQRNKEKGSIVFVPERLWQETKKGFDKLHTVVYNEDIGHYVLQRKFSI